MNCSQKSFDSDVKAVLRLFPKIHLIDKEEHKYLIGDIDIFDTVQDYWGTFEVKVIIPQKYPFAVPTLIELSKLIPRETAWHISADGQCCVEIDHELLHLASKGLRLLNYMQKFAYPYLANQMYRLKSSNDEYASGEHPHHFEGVIKYYNEKLCIDTPALAIHMLEWIVSKPLPGRNDPCPCGSGNKSKFCHLPSMRILKSIGRDRVQYDLESFKRFVFSS